MQNHTSHMAWIFRRALTFLAIAFGLLTGGLHAQTITTRTLDFFTGPNGSTGQFTSQAIVNGNPAIAYFNTSETSLMFARNSAADGSGSWSITTLDSSGQVGLYTSLAVVNGNPAISYYDTTNGDLKWAAVVPPATAPVVTTSTSTGITLTTATLGGNVTADGGSAITERGVVYSLTSVNANPSISTSGGVKVSTTGTTGEFSVPVTSLTPSSGYSFKAYATNGVGTTYKGVATFTSTASDI